MSEQIISQDDSRGTKSKGIHSRSATMGLSEHEPYVDLTEASSADARDAD